MNKEKSLGECISRLILPDVKLDDIYTAYSSLENYQTDKQKEKQAFDLFFITSQKLTDLMRKDNQADRDEIGRRLKAAYDNIKTLDIQNIGGMEKQSKKLTVWEFLRILQENPGKGYSKLKETGFSAFPLLETIKFIFLLKEEQNDNYIFPIGNALHTIFESDELFNFSQKNYEQENTFFSVISVALMIFKETDTTQYKDLITKVKECKLDFLLIDDNGQLNIDVVRENFEKNHVLILCTSTPSHKIYIHVDFDNKSYFTGYKNIIEERNPKNGYVFGYHIEIDLNEGDRITSFEDELKKDDIETNKQLIRIIFDEGNYNVLAKKFLIRKKEGEIVPINPFSFKDKYVVQEQNNQSLKTSEEPFRKYFATILFSARYLNAVTFGTFYLLHKCAPEKSISFILDELSAEKCAQNTVIEIFLQNYPDKLESLVDIFQKEFNMVSDSTEIEKKTVNTIKIYPIRPNYDNEILNLFSQRIGKGNLNSFKIYKAEKKDGNIFLNGKKKKNLTPDKIYGDSINGVSDPFFLLQLRKKYYYFSEYQKLLKNLDEIKNNKKLINAEILNGISNYVKLETIIEDIVNLQWRNWHENKNNVFSIKDLCLMRFYYHAAILTEHNKVAIENLIEFYSKLPRITGKSLAVEEQKLLKSMNGLVILKNHPQYGNSAHEILEKYLDIYRRPHPWDQLSLTMNENQKYCIVITPKEHEEINKIIFFFDNSLSGASTVKTLKQYFLPQENDDKQNMFVYNYNNLNISVMDIIKQNEISDIIVIVMYCTPRAEEIIKELLNKIEKEKGINIELKIIKHEAQNQEKLEELAQRAYAKTYLKNQGVFILREFNQPKINWIDNKYFKPETITSLLIRNNNENL